MQQYLTSIKSIERPTFKDVSGSKIQDDFPGVFSEDTTETFNAMTKVKSSTKGVITTGLWPLDHESYYDWRHTTHKQSIWKQWIHMARIEKTIVSSYRAKMIRKCPSSRLIRDKLQVLLSPHCKPTITSSLTRPDGGSKTTFSWPDHIKVDVEVSKPTGAAATSSEARKGPQAIIAVDDHDHSHVDVQEVKSEQIRHEETNAMLADVTAIFKRLHATKAGLAVRGQEGFYKPILDKMEELEAVFTIINPIPHTTYHTLTFCLGICSQHRSIGDDQRSDLRESIPDNRSL